MTLEMALLLVVLALSAGISSTKYLLQKNPKQKKTYRTLTGLILLALLAAVLQSVIFSRLLTIIELLKYVSDGLHNYLGISIWINRAVIVATLIPLLIAAKHTFSSNRTKRTVGYGLIVGYICIYFTLMHFATKDLLFTHDSGEAQKWVSITADGEVRVYNSPGYDVFSGTILKKMTPELAQQIRFLQQNDMTDFDISNAYFHPITGDTLKWYSIDDGGSILIHDHAGFDTQTGQQLKSVTLDILGQLKQQEKAKQVRFEVVRDSLARTLAESEKEQQLRQLRKRYIVAGNSCAETVSRIALSVVNEGTNAQWIGVDRFTQGILIQNLKNDDCDIITDLFKRPFFDDGKMAQLIRGNGEVLSQLNLEKIADVFVAIEIEKAISEPSQLQGTKTCQIKMNVHTFDHNGRQISHTVLTCSGLGFTELSAHEKAVEKAASQLRDVLIKH